jgi:hypothetical protein
MPKANRLAIAALCCLPCWAGSAGARDFAPYLAVESPEAARLIEQDVPKLGLKAVTLAFLGTDGHCAVGWRGFHRRLPDDKLPGSDETVAGLVAGLQKAGIEVVLSFGGWMGADPAGHCDSPAALEAVYRQVLDLYHVRQLDFDIEGPPVTDRAAHDRRAAALKALKQADPGLTISFTLPVRPHGVPRGNGLEVLESARDAGYSPDIVNFMTMDYFTDPGPGGSMAKLTFRALDNAARQMKEMGLSSKLGVIPMIGQNDNKYEVFTLDDARALMAWLDKRPDIVRLSQWSVERDNGGCAAQPKSDGSCSGVEQAPWAYSRLFDPDLSPQTSPVR